ncbi:hypothetical protein MXB_1279 [Myxobolus squamalis]|nr:hypothetical protein MXB_1279 [Myxobolus squamalis]
MSQSLLTAVHGNFPTGAFRLPLRKTLFERIWQLRGNNVTIENINNPPFSVTSESFPFLQRDVYGEFGGRLGSFTHGVVLCVHRYNFSSNARVPLLQRFTQYHYLTEVSLVAKACRHGLGESVAERCMLSVQRH